MDDFQYMVPTPITVPVLVDEKIENVLVKQVKMKQLSDIFKAVGPLLPLMKNPAAFQPEAIFMKHTDEVMQVLCICTGRPIEWVWQLEVPDAINLFSKVLEVNLDFFTQSILPSLLKAMVHVRDITVKKQQENAKKNPVLSGPKASTS